MSTFFGNMFEIYLPRQIFFLQFPRPMAKKNKTTKFEWNALYLALSFQICFPSRELTLKAVTKSFECVPFSSFDMSNLNNFSFAFPEVQEDLVAKPANRSCSFCLGELGPDTSASVVFITLSLFCPTLLWSRIQHYADVVNNSKCYHLCLLWTVYDSGQ